MNKCKKINKYFSQEKARFVFEELTGFSFPLTRKELNGRLELDGFCKNLMLAFEYNGEQHYNPNHYYNLLQKKTKYDNQFIRDIKKKDICDKKGIQLLYIRHTTDTKTMEENIRLQLKKIGVKTKNQPISWSKFSVKNDNFIKTKNILNTKNIKLLTGSYLGSHSRHKFECYVCSYRWEAVLKDVVHKSGCPKCTGSVKHSILYIQKMCEDFGIEFLSDTYMSMNKQHDVKCQKCNHFWKVRPNNIKYGRGCPKCSGNMKIRLDQFIKILNKKHIKLNDKYEGLSKKYNFLCDICGYEWKTTAMYIWNKTGCPNCSNNKKKINIEKLKTLALKRNLKLLSIKCMGYHTKHAWECIKCKKKYYIKPYNVQRGTSCRTCKLKKGGN